MRPRRSMRKTPLVRILTAILVLAAPTTAVALAARPNSPTIHIRLSSRSIAYGSPVTVWGTAPRADAGRRVTIELAPGGRRSWRPVATATVSPRGAFRTRIAVPESGWLRAVLTIPRASGSGGASPGSRIATSAAAGISVRAWLYAQAASLSALSGQEAAVSGTMAPARAGREVWLVAWRNGGWQTLAAAYTDSHGNFTARFQAGGLGDWWLAYEWLGDRYNAAASIQAGRLTVYRQSVASWYGDGGSTGCGFHAYYGVANKTLPCGTQVQLYYHGATVTATVDDRGPYVGGREWDLNQNTAAALGFTGVDYIWSTQ